MPYNVMWGGDYVVIDDALAEIDCENILLGISIYEDYASFDANNIDISKKPYYDKVKFIEKNSKTWNRISAWDNSQMYFEMQTTKSVSFSGYLLNLSKKLAINLSDYYVSSLFFGGKTGDALMTIDPISVLTETGGGAQMAYFQGTSAVTTVDLAGSWCGDLLQIADALPDGYDVIECCFVDI